MAKYLYLSGLIMYIGALFLPAYSLFGSWNQTGWDALRFLLKIDFTAVARMQKTIEIVNFSVLVLSAVNNLFVVISPALFPRRHGLVRRRWFTTIMLIGILSLFYLTILFGLMEAITLQAGFWLWIVSILLIYLSFHR